MRQQLGIAPVFRMQRRVGLERDGCNFLRGRISCAFLEKRKNESTKWHELRQQDFKPNNEPDRDERCSGFPFRTELRNRPRPKDLP